MENEANKTSPGQNNEVWERDLVNRLAFAALNEQRRSRRWSVFFKILLFVYLFGLLFLYNINLSETQGLSLGKHTALIDLDGVIGVPEGVMADDIAEALQSAYDDKNTAGIILRINSPGGSPVQSGYINDEIHRLKKLHPDIPVYAVIEDICASGGYYIAVAADKIYADKASLVGSIGVIMNGFGFVDTLEKLGVERRLYTAGAHKGFLDPFSPENKEEVEYVKGMLDNIHQQFIKVVREGRGDRLKEDENTFSGLIWSGERGVELGLVDALGSAGYVAREVIGEEDIVDFTPKESLFARLSQRLGTSFAHAIKSEIDTPALR